MYTYKRWIAVTARANDSCLMIVKDDLLKVNHCVTRSDPYGPCRKRGYLRPIGQPARVKHLGNPAYTQLMGATRRLMEIRLPRYPYSAAQIKAGLGDFFTQITKNFVRKTRTYELATTLRLRRVLKLTDYEQLG